MGTLGTVLLLLGNVPRNPRAVPLIHGGCSAGLGIAELDSGGLGIAELDSAGLDVAEPGGR